MRPLRSLILASVFLGLSAGCGQFDYVLSAALQKGKKKPPPQAEVATALRMSGPDSLKLGRCSEAITVTAVGASGNPIALPSGGNVTLSGFFAANLQVFASSGCSNPIFNASLSIPAEEASVKFYVRALHAMPSSVTLTAASTGLTAGSRNFPIVRVPDHIEWDPAPAIHADECSAALTFRFLDYENQPIAVTGSVPVHIDGAGGLAYTAVTCGAPLLTQGAVASLNVTNASAGAFSIYSLDPTQRNLTVYTDDPAIGSDTLFVDIGSSNQVTQLLMQQGAGFEATVGSCAPVPIRIYPANAAGATVVSPQSISLQVHFSFGAGTIGTSCAGAGHTVLNTNIPGNAEFREIYVTPAASGWSTIAATPLNAGIAGTNFGFNVQDPPVGGGGELDLNGPLNINSGANAFYSVMLQDENGLAMNADHDIELEISAGDMYLGKMWKGSGTFFTTQTVNITIQAGTANAAFGLKPLDGFPQELDVTVTPINGEFPAFTRHISVRR